VQSAGTRFQGFENDALPRAIQEMTSARTPAPGRAPPAPNLRQLP
jgi:hypothetical protein